MQVIAAPPTPLSATIRPPDVEADEEAIANLRAAESLIADALIWARVAPWSDSLCNDISRMHANLRHLLQGLA